jgi:hypothetical protein
MKDTYVILYNQCRLSWVAINTKTALTGTGGTPLEALDYCTQAVDRFIKLKDKHGCTGAVKPVPDLIMKLADTVPTLPENNHIPGRVYKYERAIEDRELSLSVT